LKPKEGSTVSIASDIRAFDLSAEKGESPEIVERYDVADLNPLNRRPLEFCYQ